MIDKKSFIKSIKEIQKLCEEQETIDTLIEKISDGFPVTTIGNNLATSLIDVIACSFTSVETAKDLIEWWLYEKVDKVLHIDTMEVSVRTLEELYDFLISECNHSTFATIEEIRTCAVPFHKCYRCNKNFGFISDEHTLSYCPNCGVKMSHVMESSTDDVEKRWCKSNEM